VQERRPVAPLTRERALSLATAALVVVADVVTTSLALHHLHGTTHVWGPFGLAMTFNSGFAFSLFSGRATVITLLLCGAIAVLGFVVLQARNRLQAVGGGLVLGGAAANLGERIFSGHNGQVPDFVTLSHWPTFNVADAAVTFGVILVAASILFSSEAAQDAGPVPANGTGTGSGSVPTSSSPATDSSTGGDG
jgi:signal peptidase II